MRAFWWLGLFLGWTLLVTTGGTGWFDDATSWVATGAAHDFWASWTHLGDTALVAVATLLVGLFFVVEARPHTARRFALVVLLTAVLVFVIKAGIGRPRPEAAFEDGFAYPSGHTTVALVFFVALGRAGKVPPRVMVAATVLGLSLGVSRVALGVHYSSDVVGGWLLAGTVLALTARTVAPSAK